MLIRFSSHAEFGTKAERLSFFAVFTGTSDNKTAALFSQKDEFRRRVVKSHNGIVG